MRKNATKLAAAVLSLAMVMTSVSMPASAATTKKAKLNKTKATLYTNGTKTTTLKVLVGKKSVKATFKSSNTKILTVGKTTGKVTAKKNGTATVTATYKKKAYKCKITVKTYATSITSSTKTINLEVGKTATIKKSSIKVSPSTASNKTFNFTSSDKSVATVGLTGGKVTAKKAGTAKIYVTALGSKGKAKKATVTVNVKKADVTPTETPLVTETPVPTETPSVATEGTISVTTNVSGASVKVASGSEIKAEGTSTGTASGAAFTTDKLPIGTYTVTVSKDGYKEVSKEVVVNGGNTDVDIQLEKITYDVKSATSITNTLINLELSEAAEIAASTSEVVIKDAEGKAVETKSVVLTNDKKNFKVTTAAMTPGATYTVTVNGKTLSFVANIADTVAPELSEVKAKSNTKVELTFSEKLDKDSAENVANYAVDNNLSVVKAELNSDQTKVTLTTSSQAANTVYKVTVSKVTDLAGNAVNTDKNNAEFGGIAADTAKPEVSAVATVTNTKVRVFFNEALDKASAETITNYAIDNKLSVLKAEYKEVDSDKNGDVDQYYVELTTTSQTEATIYKVTVSNVKDVAGNVVESTKNSSLFAGLKVDTVKPNVEAASTVSNTKVDVFFNEEMDKASVENIANYSVDNGLTVLKAEQDKDDAKKVTLTTSAQTAGKIYKVTIANVKDLSGNVVETTKNTAEFGGVEADTKKPAISSVMPASATELEVKFDEKVDKTTAQYAANYFVQGLGYATKAELATDGVTVKLTTLKQEVGKTYKLDVKNVQDLSGNVIDNVTKSFASGGYADTVAPNISSVIVKATDVIDVVFDEKLSAVGNYSNYYLNGTALGSTDVVKLLPDKKTVRIVLKGESTSLKIGEIKEIQAKGVVADLAGNIATETSKKKFVVSTLEYSKPSVASVIATDTKTVVVKFNDYVESTSANTAGNYTITKADGKEISSSNNPTVAKLSDDGKTVTLTFDSTSKEMTFTSGKLYDLKITGVKDITEEKTIDDTTKSFAGTGKEDTVPQIVSVNADDKQVITVKFNQELASSSKSALETNTSWEGITVKTAKLSDDNKTVKLYLAAANALETGKVYKLNFSKTSASGVTNVAGKAMDGTKDNILTFAASSVNHAAPKIESAYVTSEGVVRIKFNQILDQTTPLAKTDLIVAKNGDETNGTISLASDSAVVEVNEDGIIAGTTFDIKIDTAPAKFIKGELYTIRIDNDKKVTDLTGTDSTARDKVEFGGIAPAMVSAVYKKNNGNNNDTITLTFNTELNETSTSTTVGDYTVNNDSSNITVSSVAVKGNTVVLTLTENDSIEWNADTTKLNVTITDAGKVKDKAATPNSNEAGAKCGISGTK